MELKNIAVDEIQPNPFQPRESFEKESLRELADSIMDASVIQPIVVRRHGKGYQIIAGERRWRAAQMAGLKEVPSLIKDIPEGRVLLESLIENLHRKDLTDIEMENAIHQLWENNEALGFKTIMELAKKLGVHSDFVSRHLDAWEIRHEEHVDKRVSTDAIRVTRGLEVEERKKLLEKVAEGDLGVRETYTAVKVLRKASQPLKHELLKSKTKITPKIAETIVENIPNEEEQKAILDEAKRLQLTEDEIEEKVRTIQHLKEMGKPSRTEMDAREGTIYTVGEYDCPHCKRHYVIKCDGKKDWLE
jgi:ParB family chromosome partitioning protein